jgi:MOSC domain-containing protein YiiM
MGERGWLKKFTVVARPGAYLSVVTPGYIQAGDPITVVHRPGHPVSISLVYRASTTQRELLPSLLEAGDDLDDDFRDVAVKGELVRLG